MYIYYWARARVCPLNLVIGLQCLLNVNTCLLRGKYFMLWDAPLEMSPLQVLDLYQRVYPYTYPTLYLAGGGRKAQPSGECFLVPCWVDFMPFSFTIKPLFLLSDSTILTKGGSITTHMFHDVRSKPPIMVTRTCVISLSTNMYISLMHKYTCTIITYRIKYSLLRHYIGFVLMP